jgi:hypothetical protein
MWRRVVLASGTIALASAAGCGADESDPGATASTGGASTGGGASGGTAGAAGGDGGRGGRGASSTGGGGSGGALLGGGGASPDPCLDAQPTCPVPPAGLVEGSGLVAIDRCAFPLTEQGFQSGGAADQLFQALTPRSVADVLADLNRTATPTNTVPGNPANVSQAFGWNSGDQSVAYWIPQGLTGSADASPSGLVAGREVVLASWYYELSADPGSTSEKGVRLSLADVTDPAAVSYRHLLLVEPVVNGAQVDFVPVVIHAGGIAWIDDYLYVADTSHGFRVFDMSKIAQVATGKDVIGYDAGDGVHYAANYKYVVPQIGNYERSGACTPRFSFVALDRSTSPPSLVSGEYDASSLFGRLFHWPLAAGGDRLATPTSFPDRAFFSAHSHLQGAVSYGATHWLSSSEPPAGAGDLYVAAEATASTVVGWVDAPEDLVVDAPRGKLWGLSEGIGERFVFAVSPSP